MYGKAVENLLSNMDILLNFLLVLSLFITTSAGNECPLSENRLNKSYRTFFIRFPFKVQGHPKNCGYPGFDLTITTPDLIPTVDLPNSGEFSVRDIDYRKQEIQLYDPLGCLPNRLISLNLSSSPFTVSYYRNYTFLSCSPEVVVSKSSAIDCLSNSTATVMATSSLSLVREMNTCTIIFEKAIPVRWPDQNDGLTGDLMLSWNLPGCADCEKKGKLCGFANGSSMVIACYYSGNDLVLENLPARCFLEKNYNEGFLLSCIENSK